MVKIIKPGIDKSAQVLRYECRHCECVFEATKGESSEEADFREGYPYWKHDCPTCGKSVSSRRVKMPIENFFQNCG